MTVAAWSDFFPYILPFVRGCDGDTVSFQVVQTAIDFCRRTQCWRTELAGIVSVANQEGYTLPIPSDAELSRLLAFEVDGDDSYAVTNPELGRSNDRNFSLGSYAYLSDDRSQIFVQPVPECDGLAIVPYVSLKPTRAATTFPDDLFEEYVDDIANGALSRLLKMPKVDWRDVACAVDKEAEYRSRCGIVAAVVAKGSARTKQRVNGTYY